MSQELCYTCEKPLPSGQSYYEDHGVKVCLNCFRTTKRCLRCRFPSRSLKNIPGFGDVCEFCEASFTKENDNACYVCNEQVWKGASFYSGHGKTVCQKCFAESKNRCFSCHFPVVEGEVIGLGDICRFCRKDNIDKRSDLNPIIQSIIPFLKSHQHQIVTPINIQWIDWRLILGMQVEERREYPIANFDELIRYCYPILYLKERFYIIPSLSQRWFIVHIAGQLAAADICQSYRLPHLLDNGPFQQLARGWCHWGSFNTAKALKYKDITRSVSRYPTTDITGSFSKFQAMSEFRKSKEIIQFAQKNLKKYAKKYL
ncbi:MAG: hypothetical protein HOE30_03700 [Deltaproteobacteria bacterium]|nr:hypothetical protein [Deltaproteobacteria bacterium]